MVRLGPWGYRPAYGWETKFEVYDEWSGVAFGDVVGEEKARLVAVAPALLALAHEVVAWEQDPDAYAGDLADLAHKAAAIIAKTKPAEGR